MAKARKAPKADSTVAPQEAHEAQASNIATPDASSSDTRDDSTGSTPKDQQPEPEGQQTAAAKAPPQDAGNADSSGQSPEEHKTEGNSANALTARQATKADAGNVPNPTTPSDSPIPYARVRERLMKHAEWGQIVGTVKEMRLDPKLAKMRAEHRERFIWGEMDRLYPPVEISKAQSSALLDSPKPSDDKDLQTPAPRNSGSLQGLNEIPESWPTLPASAGLAAEVAWVQANRLYVVEELASGGTRVHLERAHEPAPSRSALGWLETSIRSYAKFVEVAAKVSGPGADEGEQIKREKLAIEEIRGLLAEMAGNPTGPGR